MSNNHRRSQGNRSKGRRPAGRRPRGPKFVGARMILGIFCVAAAFVFVYRSCLAGVIREGAGLGLMGLIPSVLFLMAGITAIQMMHRSAPVAFLIPSVLFLGADITSLIHAYGQTEWKVWGILAGVFAVLFSGMLILHRRRNVEAPAVLLAAALVITLVLCIVMGKGSDEKNASGKLPDGQEQEESGNTVSGEPSDASGSLEAASQDPGDGTLFLATDSFTLKYVKHELGEDVNGASCLYVYYDFTNNSSEAVSIPSVSYTKLIQNGTECSKASVAEQNDEMVNYKTEVQPQTTVTACEVYALTDTSDVELQAVEFVPTNGKTASQVLSLE